MTAKLNFRSALFLLLPALVLTFGCMDMKLDIQDLKDRLDVLEGTPITSINEQISAINTSISDLNEIDETLDAYIKALETTATDLQKQINGADAEIAKVKSELGEEISSLEQSLLNELNTAKEAIEAELLAINNTLTGLKQADEALDKKISDLQTHVDTQLTSTTNWAEATFATLEQYSAMQAEISAIKTLIDKTKADITEEYTAAIETAVSNSETSMKAWVNTLLAQGYYTISDINGKVSALEALIADGDSNLQKQINEQKAALHQAKTDLTNEYKQYINQAIASGGIIDQAIATQVKKAQDELQSTIDAINERLDALEDRLGKLEEDFVNRIQSLKYIPEYSDRKVKMKGSERVVSLDFQVSPSIQAEEIEKAWKKDYGVVSGSLRVVKNPETRSINPSIALNVISVTGKSDGVLTIVLNADNVKGIDDEFLAGISNGVISVRISDGNNDIFSDLIDVSCLDLNVFEDLSPLKETVYQTANCYIVNKPGLYKFKAYRGNSQDLAGAVSDEGLPEGMPVSANVLWESFGTSEYILTGDLIDYVRYFNEYVVFRKTNNENMGNAVLAVTNKDKMILWSWHIWMTEKPTEQVYYNDAGIMMDRNLGATSAVVGDKKAGGLLYQKARKDPFVYSSGVQSTVVFPEVNKAVSATLRIATMNPTVQYKKGGKGSWMAAKTIHDPCPAGWRIPDGGATGVWAKASSTTTSAVSKFKGLDKENGGVNFTNWSDDAVWYPVTPGQDNTGLYWSNSSSGMSFNENYLTYYNDLVFPNDPYRWWGDIIVASVRCQKE